MEHQRESGQALSTTLDGLLNRRIALEQPAKGFRVAVDTVFLAAAVPALSEQTALELGCGVGGAMLALAWRVPGVTITGLEVQTDMARLCQSNIERNNRQTTCRCVEGDATRPLPSWQDSFDHVFANPPYHDEGRHDVSANLQKRRANAEPEGDLARWIHTAHFALKPGGCLTIIHRADRMDALLAMCCNGFGAIRILPILSHANDPPTRIILRAVKGPHTAFSMAEPFIVHEPQGRFTDKSHDILRNGCDLPF